MQYKHIDDISIENAQILFRNFSGAEDKFNAAGNRNFCVIIEDPDMADQLKADGWNIRILKPRDPEEEPRYYLQVSVKFNKFPPNVYLITSHSKTKLDEDTVGTLDYADLKNVDLIITPYQWEMRDKSGVKAYLRTGYFVIEEDKFAEKYAMEEAPEEVPF